VAARVDPPYRLQTERLVIRCWEPRDAPLLKDAVDASLEHLRPWMPWAEAEPQPLGAKVALLREFRGHFDLGQEFVYGLFDADEAEVVGGSGLHTRVGPEAFEIGYWVRADREGRGLVTEAVAALTRVAFEVARAERVEIRVDPANERSLGVPRRLGFVEEATLRRRLPGPAGDPARRDVVVFSLLAGELADSPAGGIAVQAFDAQGERLL
jgi:RimJ/RimL family protein N-acetyltransferase